MSEGSPKGEDNKEADQLRKEKKRVRISPPDGTPSPEGQGSPPGDKPLEEKKDGNPLEQRVKELEEKYSKSQKTIKQLTMTIVVNDKEKDKLQNRVAELENMLKLKEKDQAELIKGIEKQCFNPIFFTSTSTREEFWRMLDDYAVLVEKRSKFEDTLESVTSELKCKIHGLELELEHKNKLLLEKELTEYNNRKLSMEVQGLWDQLRTEQAKMKENSLKLTTLEKHLHFTEKERDDAVRSLMEVTQLFNERLSEAENEKQKLFETIKKLRDSRLGSSTMERAILGSFDALANKKKLNLDQIFIRLKTTANTSDKFAEIIEILEDILMTIRKEEDFGTEGEKTEMNKRILDQMKDPTNYRFYLKALHSHNHKVIVATTKFLLDLGDVNLRAKEYMDLGASSALVKILRVSADENMKHCAVTFLSKLSDSTPEICKEIQGLGAVPKLIEEVKANSKGTSLISKYLKDLLNLILQLLKVNQGKEEFSQNSIVDQFIHILSNTESQEIKIILLSIILYISEKTWQRARLQEKNCFSILMSIFSEAILKNEPQLINASITSIAHFSEDKPFRIFIANSHGTYKTYRILFQCMDMMSGVPAPTRLAAAGIISRMIRFNDFGDIRTEMMTEGVMGPLISGLADEEEVIQKECVIALTNLAEYVPKYLDSFIKALGPLVAILQGKVPDLIIKSLNCLTAIVKCEAAIPFIVETGIVGILCRTFLQDITSVPSPILEASGYLLLTLIENEQAREVMIREKILYALLPLYTHEHDDIQKFWYEAMSEFCNFKEFRAQLESDVKTLGFVKKALYDANNKFFEQIAFIVRCLLQSGLLATAMVDEITIPRLFDVYYQFLPTATQKYLIYIYQSLDIFCNIPSARYYLALSEFILEMILVGIQKEDTSVSNEAAAVVISILKLFTKEERRILYDLPLVEAVIMYARANDRRAREQSQLLAQYIREDSVFSSKLAEANRAFITPPATQSQPRSGGPLPRTTTGAPGQGR